MSQPMTQSLTHSADPAPRERRRFARHPLSIGHLVMGLVFLGLVGIWALVQADAVTGDDIRWLLPVPWVLAGVAGLLATTLSGRGRDSAPTQPRTAGWVDAPAPDDLSPQSDQPVQQPTPQTTDQPTDQQETR